MTNSSRRFGRQPSKADQDYTTEDLIERAVNEARKLPSYDSDKDEESTARHNIPQDIHFHVHAPQQSSPEIEVETEISIGPLKAKGLPKWATAAVIGIGVVAAVATAIASHFAAK
jgi:hypothetical protein